MAYYLKYRSKNVDELDLASARETLKSIIKSGNIPHAFLFSGPKGTGKTSAARILAKVVNCENRSKNSYNPCNRCRHCTSISNSSNIDVIEMDAASNRGFDDIRNLRDAIKLSPASAKKKVYIIDEAHMLTTEASNALLKSLEEPPEHVIFILATTNPEKLLDTIVSRTTNINFKHASSDEIVRSLKRVVAGEGIKIDESSLIAISRKSEGSFRDAHKLLEQIVSEGKKGKKISNTSVEEFLSYGGSYDVNNLLECLVNRDIEGGLKEVIGVYSTGASVSNYVSETIAKLRSVLLSRYGVGEGEELDMSSDELIYLIELLSSAQTEIKNTPLQHVPLEIAVIKWCSKSGKTEDKSGKIKVKKVSDQATSEKKAQTFKKDNVGVEKKKIEEYEGKNPTHTRDLSDTSAAGDFSGGSRNTNGSDDPLAGVSGAVSSAEADGSIGAVEQVWKVLLSNLRNVNASTEALLRASKPLSYDGKMLNLGVYYKFHKEKLEEYQHMILLENTLSDLLGNRIKIICTLVKQTQPAELKEIELDNQKIKNDNYQDGSDDWGDDPEDEILKAAKDIFN